MLTNDERRERKSTAYRSVTGFLFLVPVLIMAYFAGQPAMQWLDSTVKGFPPAGIPTGTWLWLVRGVLFVVLSGVGYLIVAMLAPKRRSEVVEKTLVKQRQDAVRQKKLDKGRQRYFNNQPNKK